MMIPDSGVFGYDLSFRNNSCLPEEMRKRLPIGVRERMADDMSACWIGSNCSTTILHSHSSALDYIQ